MQSPDPGLAVAEREIERAQQARLLGAELWSGAVSPDAEDLRWLIADGLEKGFLTYDEIAAALEDVGLTREQTEDFYTYLVERSIELVEGEQHKHPSHEQPALVEDEPQISNFLRIGLGYEGFSVAVAEDGYEALAELKRFKPQLVILDLMLPGISGMELAERMRGDPDLMIIILTARDQVEDRIAGLNAGADDYLVKPFDFEELVARIHAVTRRRGSPEAAVLKAGQLTLDREGRVVTMNGEAVELTAKEFELLLLFMTHPGRVLSRRFILDQVWGHEFYDANNVEVYVRYLRRKLGDSEHELIETVRGVGYRLRG